MPRKVSKARARMLAKELREYEAVTEMTPEERQLLHEWVADGNSVYENPCFAIGEGDPSDFLDVYRHYEEIRQELASMTPRQRENYLARLRGEDTIDNLREDLDEIRLKAETFEFVLTRHGLLEEAERELQACIIARENGLWSELGDEIEGEELPF